MEEVNHLWSSEKSIAMDNRKYALRFIDGQHEQQIISGLQGLKKELSTEVLYTTCGLRIQLDQLLSITRLAF